MGGEIQPIREKLFHRAQNKFSLAFPKYQAQRGEILGALQQLLNGENIKAALLPPKPLQKKDIGPLAPRIKEKEVSLAELKEYGVIPSYDFVGAKDIYIHSSLYALPAAYPFSREASFHPEEYREMRPSIVESRRCNLPTGEPAYLAKMRVLKFGGSMVVHTPPVQDGVGHFHLAPKCIDSEGNIYETDNVRFLDGIKIYHPVAIERDGKRTETTIVLSATITVWDGLTGKVMKKFGSAEDHARTYGLGGLSEILAVLKRLP